MLPAFTSQENADVNWKVYKIITAIIHLGPNQNSGHYRVAAFTPDHTNCWYSNDNQAAERLSVTPEEIKERRNRPDIPRGTPSAEAANPAGKLHGVWNLVAAQLRPPSL